MYVSVEVCGHVCNKFVGKRTGDEKKLAKALDHQIAAEFARSPASLPVSASPFGPLSESQSRKTFIDLIATLNASFPDYDFRFVRMRRFVWCAHLSWQQSPCFTVQQRADRFSSGKFYQHYSC